MDSVLEDATQVRKPAARRQFAVAMAIVGALVAGGLALMLLTLSRGFDWTDEGFVYAMIASNRVADGEFWGFQHLLHPLFVLTGESVLVFRALRLLGYIAVSVVAVLGTRAVVTRLGFTRFSRRHWLFVLLVAQLGTFAAWGYPPRYLGYNELASWIAQAGCVLVVVLLVDAVAAPRRNAWVTAVLWAVVGVAVAALAFIKIPSGVLFGLVALLALAMPSRAFAWWKRLLAVAFGGFFMLGVLAATGYPIVSYLSSAFHLLTDASAQQASDHSLSAMIPTYLGSLEKTLVLIALPLALVVLVAFGLVRASFAEGAGDSSASTRRAVTGRALWMLAILAAVAVYVLPADSKWNEIGAAVAFLGASAVIILVLLGNRVVSLRGRPGHPHALLAVGIVTVAVAPFISAAGTNNTILGQTLFSATVWAALFGFALCALYVIAKDSAPAASVPLMLAAAMVAIFVGFVVNDVFVQPYRTAPYFQQRTVVDAGPLRGMSLTPDEAELASWLDGAADRQDASDVPTVAIASPGALLSFNQSDWANPWIDPMWPVSFASVSRACDGERPSDLIVLQPGEAPESSAAYQGFAAALATCDGLSFPSDFEVVEQFDAEDPGLDMTVWRLAD